MNMMNLNLAQVDHVLRCLSEFSKGIYNMGQAALTIAEVNRETLPMIKKMGAMMEKFEPLADHALECMKKELEAEKE